MSKNIVLCGKTSSGKTTVAKIIENRGFKRIITYTTRPIRPGETDEDYHFISNGEFLRMMTEDCFAETAEYNACFGKCRYGSAKKDYLSENSIIILNPIGIVKAHEVLSNCLVVYLDVSDDILVSRATSRGDDVNEITRRLAADREDFNNLFINEYVDLVIDCTGKTPEEIADIIICKIKD